MRATCTAVPQLRAGDVLSVVQEVQGALSGANSPIPSLNAIATAPARSSTERTSRRSAGTGTRAVLVLFLSLAPRGVSAQCVDRPTQTFGEGYGERLGGSLVGAPIGATGGAVLGLVLPLVFCNAGIGDGGCGAAWIGTGTFALGGWLLGTTLGAAAARDVPSEPGAAAGLGVLAGGLMFAGGLGLRELTGEPAFLGVSIGLWMLTTWLVAPLAMNAMEAQPCTEPP